MAFIDSLLRRSPEETARAEAMREFRRVFKSRGILEERGLNSYYDARYGPYSSKVDVWEPENVCIFKSNPQLRRVDIFADAMFMDGLYRLVRLGDVISPQNELEGSIALVRLRDDGSLSAMLTLDIGDEVRFTKLRIGHAINRKVYVVRPSSLDGGIVIEADENERIKRDLPLSVSDRSANPMGIFRTVMEAIEAMKLIIGQN
jgi:hypothetical protein